MKISKACPLVLLLIVACGGGGSNPSIDTPPPPPVMSTPERITFEGGGDLGIFDPSISQDPNSNRLWMSYSSVETSDFYPSTEYWAVSIRLAYSDDSGITWQDGGVLVAPKIETTVGPLPIIGGEIPAASNGIWQSETSSLIYDPSPASEDQRWKLIWSQYLHADSKSLFADYAWIASKTAATPLELATAEPTKLFSGFGLQAQSSNTGMPVFAPIGGDPLIRLNLDLDQTIGGADLNDLALCVFAEPGMLATNNALYLAVYCADLSTQPLSENLVYFRCNSPCNMQDNQSWEYLGKLLTPEDALSINDGHHFQAPQLVEKGDTIYLLVTPVDTSVGERYNGCRVYEFVDINSNQLRRENGELNEVVRIDGEPSTHNGACSAITGLDGGILLSQFEADNNLETFNIYKSQVDLP